VPIDLLFRYPFPGGDGYDWIASGLAMAGEATRASGRPPLLPAAIALLYRLGALALLPFLLLALLLLLAVACARIAVPEGERLVARRLRAGALLFASAVYLRQGLEVMADVGAAALGAAGLALALSAMRRGSERRWLAAGALVGIGSLAQPAALYAVAGIGCVLLLERRPLLRTRAPWLALAAAVAPAPLALWLRYLSTGSPENVAFLHRTLVGWHPEQLAYYARALPAALGAPALLLVVAGTLLLALRARRAPLDAGALAALGSALSVALFFGVLYGFPAQRFTLYLAPLVVVAYDRALEALRARTHAVVAGAVAGLSLVTAAIPSGGERTVVLWPAPLVLSQAPGGELYVGALGEALARHPLPALASYLASPDAELDLAGGLPGEVEAVIYLYDEARSDENFFVEALRLGNAFGRRGRALPVGLLPDGFLPRGSLEPLGSSLGYRFDRLRLPASGPGGERAWLLAASVGSGIDPGRWLAPARRGPEGATLVRALDQARCVDALLPARDAPLVLFGDERVVPVVAAGLATRTGTLLVVPPAGAARWRARWAGLPREAERRCGDLAAARVLWEGFPYTVATAFGAPR